MTNRIVTSFETSTYQVIYCPAQFPRSSAGLGRLRRASSSWSGCFQEKQIKFSCSPFQSQLQSAATAQLRNGHMRWWLANVVCSDFLSEHGGCSTSTYFRFESSGLKVPNGNSCWWTSPWPFPSPQTSKPSMVSLFHHSSVDAPLKIVSIAAQTVLSSW